MNSVVKSIPTNVNYNLDLLRACAVLIVLVGHTASTIGFMHGAAFGNFGVLIFFVHTSLVLAFSMERQGLKGPRGFWIFYVRRFFRIYPLSVVCVGIVVFLRIPFVTWGNAAYLPPSTLDLVSNLALIQNITNAPNLQIQLWSLPPEVQMYLVLPALYLIVRNSRSLVLAIGLWIAAVALCLLLPSQSLAAELAGYSPCFLGGIIAYVLSNRKKGSAAPLASWLWPVTIGAILIGYIGLIQLGRVLHPHLWKWLACLTLGLCLNQFALISSSLLKAASHIVAKYSYGVYLTHLFALRVAFLDLQSTPWPVRALVFMALMILFPALAYHLIEEPMIEFGKRITRETRKPVPANRPAADIPPAAGDDRRSHD